MRNTIAKSKTLEEQLLSIQEGYEVIVKYIHYSPEHVRRVVSGLNKKGYYFTANTSRVDNGIIVTRVR